MTTLELIFLLLIIVLVIAGSYSALTINALKKQICAKNLAIITYVTILKDYQEQLAKYRKENGNGNYKADIYDRQDQRVSEEVQER